MDDLIGCTADSTCAALSALGRIEYLRELRRCNRCGNNTVAGEATTKAQKHNARGCMGPTFPAMGLAGALVFSERWNGLE